MPSSHTGLIVGLTCAIGVLEGTRSNLFALAMIVSLVVMYDASGEVSQAPAAQAHRAGKAAAGLQADACVRVCACGTHGRCRPGGRCCARLSL
jgi:acid phosphatase family membrane protein YuiD